MWSPKEVWHAVKALFRRGPERIWIASAHMDKKTIERTSPIRLWTLLLKCLVPFLMDSKRGRRECFLVLFLMVLNTVATVGLSFITKETWDALSQYDHERFIACTLIFVILILVGDPIYVFYKFRARILGVIWRQWLSTKMLDMYYTQRGYYALEAEPEIDNPDQRMSQDVKNFTELSVRFITEVSTSAIDIFAFSFILMRIYMPLFFFLLAYTMVGSCAGFIIGRKLIILNFYNLMSEADLRYSLMRVRENCESIAFFRGEARERYSNLKYLMIAIDNDVAVFSWQRNLDYFLQFYVYLVQVVPVLMLAPMYFDKHVSLGSMQQAWAAFNAVLRDMSVIVLNFDSVSEMSAALDRIGEFLEYIEERQKRRADRKQMRAIDVLDFGESASSKSAAGVDESREGVVQDGAVVTPRSRPSMERRSSYMPQATRSDYISLVQDPSVPMMHLERVTLTTPGEDAIPRVLIRDLELNLQARSRLLVVGPSGAGKSSLLRAIAGLWDTGSGTIRVNVLDNAFFLPQRPYCTFGSLRDQVTYPMDHMEYSHLGTDFIDARIEHFLAQCNLPRLIERVGGLNAQRNWARMLSLGEQQRVAFARMLLSQELNRAKFVLLDEASSALDPHSEALMYNLMVPPFVSVGHRPSLIMYHDVMLRILGEGEWRVELITDAHREAARRAAEFIF